MQKLTLKQLDSGIDASISNAGSLIEEAQLLLKFGFHARAYTLSHIAREELSKVTMLYSSGLRMLAGHPVDWGKLHKRLRDHKSKLTSDALQLFVGTPGAATTLPLEKFMSGSSSRNEWKNESLYVALKGETFKTPSEMITFKKAERTIILAMFVLDDARRYVSIGGKLTNRNPKEVKKIFENLDPNKVTWEDCVSLITQLAKHIKARTDSTDQT
jgi:AbiV family abortive infection protein